MIFIDFLQDKMVVPAPSKIKSGAANGILQKCKESPLVLVPFFFLLYVMLASSSGASEHAGTVMSTMSGGWSAQQQGGFTLLFDLDMRGEFDICVIYVVGINRWTRNDTASAGCACLADPPSCFLLFRTDLLGFRVQGGHRRPSLPGGQPHEVAHRLRRDVL